MTDVLFVGLGLAILLLAGDLLVRGAVNLSLRLGVPALIVGLTIVAFGTSAPELLISIEAVLLGAPGLALGNVVGSNIANVLLVLGVPAILSTLRTVDCNCRKSFMAMIFGTVLFIGLCALGPLTWVHGIILLSVLAIVIGDQFIEARNHRRDATNSATELEEIEGADPHLPWWRIFVFLVLGLVGLPLGANILVDSSVNIAREFGVSETVIGLTLVAVGTSLPELATTVTAALRKEADVALGNVIGSNMFNLLAIMGVTTMFGSIPIDEEFFRLDFWIMLGSSLLLAPFVFGPWNLSRPIGVALTSAFCVYVLVLLT